MGSVAVRVIGRVVASLFVSLTIIPWLSSVLLGKDEGPEGNRFLRTFDRGIHASYAPLLDRALRRPAWMLAISAAFVAASFALVPVVGFSLFPKAETPQFRVDITPPEGASIAATDSAALFAERVLARTRGVKAISTSVGHDNPRAYYTVASRTDDPRVGQLLLLLDHY